MITLPEGKKYHIFLAHSGKDTEVAIEIKRLLGKSVSVFLDCESILPGDAWDTEIPKAQQESLITVILVSKNIEHSFYQQEEVAGAIALSRESLHRVVPVYLDESVAPVPYGLRRIHSINIKKERSLNGVTEHLLKLVEKVTPEHVAKDHLGLLAQHEVHPNTSSKLEVNVKHDGEPDGVSLIPTFSSEDLNKVADRTTLFVYLSEVEVVNHDVSPTTIQSLWVSIWEPKLQRDLTPAEILEEELIGNRRIEARSQCRYKLKSTLIFNGAIPRDETVQIMLRVRAIGLGEAGIRLTLSKGAAYGHHKDDRDASTSVIPSSFIPPDLIGRDDIFQKLLTKLRDDSSVQVVGIWGMGGIGKTFLASRVAQRLLDEPGGFTDLIIIESRSSRLSLPPGSVEAVTYEAILDRVLERVKGKGSARMNQTEKEIEVKKIFSNHRILLFADNLETTEDNLAIETSALITLFSGTRSKALLVSRFALPCDSEPLDELKNEDARKYVRWRLRIVGVSALDATAVQKVAESVGGSPLAIELVVGLISKLPKALARLEWDEAVKDVLDRVVHLRVQHKAAIDPAMQFFLDIFWLSWSKVSSDNKLIYYLIGSSPANVFTIERLQSKTGLERETILLHLRELYELALVHIASREDGTVFFLHPLTDTWAIYNLLELGE